MSQTVLSYSATSGGNVGFSRGQAKQYSSYGYGSVSGYGSSYGSTGRRAQSMIQSSRSQRVSSAAILGSGLSSAVRSGGSRLYGSGGSFRGSGSGGYSAGLIQATTAVDLSLPLPRNDTSQQQVRAHERQQMVGLNDKFVGFIDKVRVLEEQNKKLEIKLNLLKEQGTYTSNIDSMFQAYIDNLKRQLETLGQEKLKFEADLLQMQGLVEDFKGKYEDEINRRTEMENEFVLVKKDVDDSYMNKVELEAKLESLTDEIDFLRSIFAEEIRELQAQIQNTSVSVQLDSRPSLNVDNIVAEARLQYQTLAERSRAEADAWKMTKMQELSTSTGQYGDELRILKSDIQDLTNYIRKMNGDIDRLKQERLKLEAEIGEAEERGELSLKDAKLRIQALEAAIAEARKELAIQVREYQDLMIVKLALDLEIETYKKLLEGEEHRMDVGVKTINIQQVQGQGQLQQFGLSNRELSGFVSGGYVLETSTVSSGHLPSNVKPLLVRETEQINGITVSSSTRPLN